MSAPTVQATQASTRLRSYAELTRISNLPTVWTNVLTGAAIGASGAEAFPWATWALVASAVSLLYVGGMAMNDVMDVEVDRKERPMRPIPSGRVSMLTALILVVACLAGGAALLTAVGGIPLLAAGLALILAITLYNWLHQRVRATVILMGLCRGLIYLVAALAVSATVRVSPLILFVAAITLYTILVTIVARAEASDRLDARRWLALLIPFSAVAPVAVIGMEASRLAVAVGVIMVVWLLWVAMQLSNPRAPTVHAIMAWLAGICLLDAFYLSLLAEPLAAGLALVCFVVTRLGHRRILGS